VIKPILASAVLHGFFITIILLASAAPHESSGFVDNRIRIRIDGNPNVEDAVEPAAIKSRVPSRDLSNTPKESAPDFEQGSIDDESIDDAFVALLNYEPLASPRSEPSEQIQGIEVMEPLADFDEQSNPEASPQGSWLIDWVGGRERGILSFPVVDAAQFPKKSEKLLDVVIKIRVSPQGEVLSAELVPPGSGDTRIDRYMHRLALQLTLEPWFENGKIQEAYLRLLFLEDDL